ncbi:MAG: protein kinase [Pirellulales bacterium]
MSQNEQSHNSRLEELLAHCLRAIEAGRTLDRERLIAENPEFAAELTSFLNNRDAMQAWVPRKQPTDQTLSAAPGAASAQAASAELARLLEAYLAELQAGRSPDRASWLQEHLDLARELAACLDGLEFVHRAQKGEVTRLGDFRIVREIGRGGMGVVYEAEQISLRRRVALKVLKIGGVADEAALERFQREAETVAHLHHTNIVPIFAVGSEAGVHYYAMQLIEGQSLDQWNRESHTSHSTDAVRWAQTSPSQVDPRQKAATRFIILARWCGEAAEALAHAHERGVIHRDVKPSNLLLDVDGRLWLTDFGLARRAEEATLTLTGAMLGTPRYMSPEQVRAVQDRIDHRTDIYSLGATLYELATGRPLFEADSPHAIVRQILDVDPAPPRSVCPDLPRDLETIILKCLAKNSIDRYATARELADDLRRFVSGDPIRARRTTPLEHALRWMKQQRRSVAVAAAAALASCVLAVSAVAWWDSWRQADQAGLKLLTAGPKLRADILDARTGQRVARFTVPTEEPQRLRAGEYRVKLSGEGQFSESFEWTATRRQIDSVEVSQTDRLLWQAPRGGQRFMLGNNVCVITSPKQLQLRDGVTGQLRWELSLDWKDQTLLDQMRAAAKTSRVEWNQQTFTLQPDDRLAWRPPRVAEFAQADVDQDGHTDLLIASTRSPSLLAISGHDGKLLWARMAEADLPPGIDPATLHRRDSFAPSSRMLGQPLAANLKGQSLVICVWWIVPTHVWYLDDKNEPQSRWDNEPQIWVEALATHNGQVAWRRRLPKADVIQQPPAVINSLILRDGVETLALVIDAQLFGIRLADGQQTWEDRLPGTLVRPPQFADDNGDGAHDSLLWEQFDGQQTIANFQRISSPRRLESTSDKSQEDSRDDVAVPEQTTDRYMFSLATPPTSTVRELPVVWFPPPLAADLNGDQRLEFVAARWPDLTNHPHDVQQRIQQVTIAVASKDGEFLWQRTLRTAEERQTRFLVGADLNQDGWRDVYVVTLGPSLPTISPTARSTVFLDVLSGQSGQTLRIMHWEPGIDLRNHELQQEETFRLQWLPTADDSPRLAVTVYSSRFQGPSPNVTALIDIEQLTTIWDAPREILHDGEIVAVDLNGDGWGELLSGQGEQLRVLRGAPPDLWRRFAILRPRRPAADLDGDGLADALSPIGDPAAAFSSRTGQRIWSNSSHPFTLPLASSDDLDADGTADLLSMPSGVQRRLTALSGRTGLPIWKTTLPLPSDLHIRLQNERLAWAEVAKWPNTESVVMFATPITAKNRQGGRFFLGCAAASDGQIRWLQPMSESAAGNEEMQLRPALADLNGDDVCDVVCLTPNHAGPADPTASIPFWDSAIELRAYNGRDGSVLWKRVLAAKQQLSRYPPLWTVDGPRPVVADLDANGNVEVLLSAVADARNAEVLALAGSDGRVVWSWSGDDADQWSNGSQWIYASPQVIRRDSGLGVALCIHNHELKSVVVNEKTGVRRDLSSKSAVEVVVLDAKGQVAARRELEWTGNRVPVHIVDMDGDNRDELLVASGHKLLALDGDLKTIRWEWPLIDRTEVVSSVNNGTALVIGLHRWYGVSVANGQTVWQAETTPQLREHQLLPAFQPHTLPALITWRGGLESASPVIASRDASSAIPNHPTRRVGSPAAHLDRDPRWARPLPWTRHSPWIGSPILWPPRLAVLIMIQPLVLFTLASLGFGAKSLVRQHWSAFLRGLVAWLLLSGLVAGIWLAWDMRYRLPEEWYCWSLGVEPLLLGVSILGLLLTARGPLLSRFRR